MQTPDSRLIRSSQHDPWEVTGHLSRWGVLHANHPRLCDQADCRKYGQALLDAQDAETARLVNEQLREDQEREMAPVAFAVLGAALVIALALAYTCWRFL